MFLSKYTILIGHDLSDNKIIYMEYIAILKYEGGGLKSSPKHLILFWPWDGI